MGDLSLEFDPAASRCIVCSGGISHWKTKFAHGQQFAYDRCARCGQVFVNPRPTLAALGWYYTNYAALSGTSPAKPTELATPAAGPPQRTLINKMLALRPGPGRFLDVGSGQGTATAAAHERGLAVTALEIEPAFVEATRRLPGVRALPLLFEQFEAGEDAFDYILMSHVLEHVHDPLAFMQKAARMLSPGGSVWVLAPSFDSIYRRILGTGDPYFIPPAHLNHFNPENLAQLCRRVGLEVMESTDYHDVPRNVIAKRFPRLLRPAIEGATAVGASIACWATGVCGWGAFVRCVARKRLA